jgi:hypothetical protein
LGLRVWGDDDSTAAAAQDGLQGLVWLVKGVLGRFLEPCFELADKFGWRKRRSQLNKRNIPNAKGGRSEVVPGHQMEDFSGKVVSQRHELRRAIAIHRKVDGDWFANGNRDLRSLSNRQVEFENNNIPSFVGGAAEKFDIFPARCGRVRAKLFRPMRAKDGGLARFSRRWSHDDPARGLLAAITTAGE